VRSANKGFYQILDINEKDTIGRYVYELSKGQWNHPDLVLQLNKVISSNSRVIDFEITQDAEDKPKKIFLLNAQRYEIREGKEYVILMAIQDITEKNKVLDMIKDKEKALRMFVSNAFDMITVHDKSGKIIFENDSIESMLGYNSNERVESNVFTSVLVHPEDRKIHEGMIRDALRHPNEWIFAEFRMQHKDGSYKLIDSMCKNLLDNPSVKGIVATYRDITKKRESESKRKEFLKQANESLAEPLAGLKAGMNQLLSHLFDKKDAKGSVILEMINEQAKKVEDLNQMIQDVDKS
jgi:PAS domain S-box-containing protein